MGVQLAKTVHSATWAHLPPTSRLLFAYMALTALDHDKPPRYFGGRDALVLSMDGYLSEDREELEGQYRRVRRALEKVKKAGGITPLNVAHTSTRAEYELTVLPFAKEVTRRPPSEPAKEVTEGPPSDEGEAVTNRPPVRDQEAVTNRPPEAVTNRPPVEPRGGHFLTGEAVTNRPPKEYEEQERRGLTRGGIDHVPAQPHPDARATSTRPAAQSLQQMPDATSVDGTHQIRFVDKNGRPRAQAVTHKQQAIRDMMAASVERARQRDTTENPCTICGRSPDRCRETARRTGDQHQYQAA